MRLGEFFPAEIHDYSSISFIRIATASYICIYNTPLNTLQYSNQSDVLDNFPRAHRRPNIDDSFTFVIRQSDTSDSSDVTLQDNDIFLD